MTNRTDGAMVAAMALLMALPTGAFGQTNGPVMAGTEPVGKQLPAASPAQSVGASAPVIGSAKPAARTTRRFEEEELRLMLREKIQHQLGTNEGELDLKFSRPWTPVTVPDGPLAVEILEPALNRLSPSMVVRFEVLSGKDVLVGTWQASLQLRFWREVLVAQTSLRRGAPFREADVARERRDVLTLHDPVCELPAAASACELTENVPLGAALTARSLRVKPVVFRGQTADALVRDGAMVISLKVEVLEEGAPGQMVRVRNQQSRRELRGIVEDEQTIAIPL